MSSRRKSVAYSCADCYFRQELVCALKTDEICPTFRPVRKAAPAAPQQAQLLDPVSDVAALTGAQREHHDQGASIVAVQTPIDDAIRDRPKVVDAAPHRVAASAIQAPESATVTVESPAPDTVAAAPSAAPEVPDRTGRIARRVAERFPMALFS